MSTRAQVIITDSSGDKLWFYRHSDGYPEGTLPSLSTFVDWIAAGRIRNNVDQAAGWLVIIGNHEYRDIGSSFPEPGTSPYGGWKVGAYEPCAPVKHGDIEYLYTVDCEAMTVSVREVRGFGESQKLGRSKTLYTAKPQATTPA